MNDAERAITEVPAQPSISVGFDPIAKALLDKGDVGLWILLLAIAAKYFDLKGLVSGHLENQKNQANALTKLTDTLDRLGREFQEQHKLDLQRHDVYVGEHRDILNAIKDVNSGLVILRDDVKDLCSEVKDLQRASK